MNKLPKNKWGFDHALLPFIIFKIFLNIKYLRTLKSFNSLYSKYLPKHENIKKF